MQNLNTASRKNFIKFSILTSSALMAFMPLTALAGFEWVPSTRHAPSPAMKEKSGLAPPTMELGIAPPPVESAMRRPDVPAVIEEELLLPDPVLGVSSEVLSAPVSMTVSDIQPVSPYGRVRVSEPSSQRAAAPLLKMKAITPSQHMQKRHRVITSNDAPEAAFRNAPYLQTISMSDKLDISVEMAVPEAPPVVAHVASSPPPMPLHGHKAPVILPIPLEPVMPSEIAVLPTHVPIPVFAPESYTESVLASPPVQAPVAAPSVIVSTIAPQKQYAEIVGFGTDLPLALALRQVVPAQYAYSFEGGVNAGARVSWRGGQAWNYVLSDMIEPLNLEFYILGNAVKIRPMTVSSAPKNVVDHAINPVQSAPAHAPYPAPAMIEPTAPTSQPAAPRRHNITDPGQKSSSVSDAAHYMPNMPMADLNHIETASGSQEELEKSSLFSSDMQAAPLSILPVNRAANRSVEKNGSAFHIWEARAGESLKETLQNWSEIAGINLIWSVPHDYKIEQSLIVNNSFASAVKSIFMDGFKEGSDKPALNLLLGQGQEQARKVLVVSFDFQNAVKTMFSEGGFDIDRDKPALKLLNSTKKAEAPAVFVEEKG